jgi:hypothetical protein
MKRTLLFSFLLAVSLGFLSAGPFGIEMGQPSSILETNGLNPTPIPNYPGYYYVLPKFTHPDFETYLVRIDEDEGVFLIKAIGKDISDNGYGTSIRSKFDELRKSIEGTYGESELISFLYPNSIWDEPEDWMMGLRKGDRIHMAQWENEDGTTLPGEISEIILAADATSSSEGYLAIEYYGKKYDELSEKAKKKAAQVF